MRGLDVNAALAPGALALAGCSLPPFVGRQDAALAALQDRTGKPGSTGLPAASRSWS